MALGGVATGSMNAYEHASVTGHNKYTGWIFKDTAKFFSTGSKIEQVATLEVTSVALAVIKHKTITMTQRGKPSKTSNCWPNKAERPETLQALARAKPPPSRKTKDQGIFWWIACQLRRLPEVLASEAEMKYKVVIMGTINCGQTIEQI